MKLATFFVKLVGMSVSTLSRKNQICIPKEIRDAIGIKPGDKLLLVVRGDHAVLMKRPGSYSAAISGVGKGLYPPGYLKKECDSWD